MRMRYLLATFLMGGMGTIGAGTANALLIHTSTPACGGFSTCDDSAFTAAASGLTLLLNDFSVDRFGGVLPEIGSVNGDIYSADFTLSSGASSFGGSDSALVQHANGSSLASEVGPVGPFDGQLVIDFATPVAAVGFGTVDHDNGTISVFGFGDVLLGTFGAGAGLFDYEGFVATGGDVITRVVLDDDFYAIQNIKYAVTTVPEPGTLALLGLGLAGLSLARRKRA